MTRSLPKLFIHIAAVVLVLGGAAVAITSRSDADSPPREKPLMSAIGDALSAPAPQGVSGRFELTNRLVDSDAAPAGSPLLAGADGRFWLGNDGRARLQLHSPVGDAEIQVDREHATVYDAQSDTVYSIPLPRALRDRDGGARPGMGEIQGLLGRLSRGVVLSGARPGTVAGHEAYTVRVAPRHDGGLLGAAELAWDAAYGVPLRAAVYAQGEREPVLELRATEVRFGAVADRDLEAARPAGARVVEIDEPSTGRSAGHAGRIGQAAAFGAVQKQLSFRLSAPESVAGLPRRSIRTARFDGATGAVVSYGKGLGALIVTQSPGGHGVSPAGEPKGLQELAIDGATAHELVTALGTVVQFERDGVAYSVIGSVPPAAAEAAARAL